jgi:hypothetical protein
MGLYRGEAAVPKTDAPQKRTKTMALMIGLTWAAATTMADGPGRSFTSLESPFTQELHGVTAEPVVSDGTDSFLGGVAFGPDADVWATECFGFRYHRFERELPVSDGHGGTVRSESLVDFTGYDPAPLGCGVVNHPDAYLGIPAMFANTLTGLWPIAADTGMPILGGPVNSPTIYAGNGRGIDIDPVVTVDHHIVYAGADCDPGLRSAATCSLFDYSSASASTLAFARFNRTPSESFGAVNFTPNGSAAFVSYQDTASGEQGFLVLARPTELMPRGVINNAQIIGRIVMSSKPHGIAFRAAGDFAVTSNDDGTMTKLVFPGPGFTGTPTQSTFASGGFRGGLMRAGADGCLYVPQGRLDGGASGVRYGDNVEAANDSIVRVCGGFAAAPGVAGAEWPTDPGRISGSSFADWNRNGIRDADEPGVADIAVALGGASTGSATTDSNGNYAFDDVAAGSYSVSVPAALDSLTTSQATRNVDLGSGEQRAGVDFAYFETKSPACTSSASTTSASFSMNDASGVRRVHVRSISNAQVSIQGGAPVTSSTSITFPSPVMDGVSISAARTNAKQSASVTLEGEDAYGTAVTCSATIGADTTTPPAPQPQPPGAGKTIREELTAWGRDHIVVEKVNGSMRYVTIRNARKGLSSVDIWINRKAFHIRHLRDGETRTLDIGKALETGKKNRVVMIGWGKWKDSAIVIISEKK